MRDRLAIKNFGPIKDVALEFNLFNIFIGDQGTGKSTLSKLYALLYNYAYYDIFDINTKGTHDINTLKFFRYLELFGLTNYLHDNTEIVFNSQKFNFEFRGGVVKSKHPELYQFSFSEMPEKLKDHFLGLDYIPAERAFASLLADALFALNEFGTKLPTLFNRFGNKYFSVRKEKVRRDYMYLLGADFIHNGGIDMIIIDDGLMLPLSDASTGLQNTMPMLVVFDSVVEKIVPKENNTTNSLLVIEEPELNLFPETQKKVINYITSNNLDNGNCKTRLIINTHSPYVLTSLNNLMYAHKVGAKEPDKVSTIIPKEFWLNPEYVSAYRLLRDGTCKKIISKSEDGILIEAGEIDEISGKLNKEFDDLIRLEIQNEVKR